MCQLCSKLGFYVKFATQVDSQGWSEGKNWGNIFTVFFSLHLEEEEVGLMATYCAIESFAFTSEHFFF